MDRWLVGGALMGLLGLTLWIAFRQWVVLDVEVPAWAWIPMGLGAVLSILVGGGLMALVFYSSRKGYDEPPRQIDPPDEE